MCVLQSPMSTGIVKYIRKSFFGTKTWGGAPQNFHWGGYGSPAPPSLPPMLSQSAKLDKNEKKPQWSLRPASEHIKGGENNNNKKRQSKTYNSRTPLTATYSQRRALYSGHFILSRRKVHTITPCSFCHVNILIQNIVQTLGVFYLYILFMIGLPSWDTISTNLAQ